MCAKSEVKGASHYDIDEFIDLEAWTVALTQPFTAQTTTLFTVGNKEPGGLVGPVWRTFGNAWSLRAEAPNSRDSL